MKKHFLSQCFLAISMILFLGCGDNPSNETLGSQNPYDIGINKAIAGNAPGAPGADSSWSYAGKTGIGTSYETYTNSAYSDFGSSGVISKVWFSLAQGIVTETAWGRIDRAQINDLQFLITGSTFFDEEKKATNSKTEYIYQDASGRPLSLAYKITNTDKENKYKIEKYIFTDSNRQALWMRVVFTAYEAGVTPYLLMNPHLGNTGKDDFGYASTSELRACDKAGADWLVVKSNTAFVKASAGFVGTSDGYTDINPDRTMDWEYGTAESTNGGNIALTAQLPTISNGTQTFDFVIGFGDNEISARSQAADSLGDGYTTVLAKFNGTGAHIGWEDYLSSLDQLSAMVAQTGDNGKELYASAMLLKTMEDKTYAGALIASLSVPWGDCNSANSYSTGYRAVWPRDFYQCASALLALGDTQTPLVSFKYLKTVQTNEGWFLQKTHVDGVREWTGIQKDQTAMPIMLGWKLWKAGVISNTDITTQYNNMLKAAGDYLKNGDNWTQQERWEEQGGYSPSTTSAIVAGLICAADIARNANDAASATAYEQRADSIVSKIDSQMFTTVGTWGNGKYYLRITQNENPNDMAYITNKNGMSNIPENKVVDGGFLEFVRYGVKKPLNQNILDSVAVYDNQGIEEFYRVRYDFNFNGKTVPGYRRYGADGYGEKTTDGSAFTGDNANNRGRVWPIFTGEKGHYELEKVKAQNSGVISDTQLAVIRDTYVRGMELFANDSYMIPEQVWDGVGNNTTYNFTLGEGTNSATPLAWSHAEYIKLVRSLKDKNTWDSYQNVRDRYQSGFQKTFNQVYQRGTNNAWGTTSMNHIADYTWQVKAIFGSSSTERFKFDVNGDWTYNFGDTNKDGIADQSGSDIFITQGAGEYTITFIDSTKAYTVVKNSSPIKYNVTGKVTNYSYNGVTITVNTGETATTDASGNYTLSLGNGTYTITPSKAGSVFNPTNRSVTVANAAVSGINFVSSQQTTNDLIVHFQEWESAATYYIHCWDGLSGDYSMDYEGLFSGSHWWIVTIPNAPASFKFCFKNSNNNWDGGNRIFTNQAREIYVKKFDNTIYTSRP